MIKKEIEAFFALVRAGLWEKDVCLSEYGKIDFGEIYRLAEEQSLVGIVAAGLAHLVDIKAPQGIVLQFVGQTLQLEQSNSAMNSFIGDLVEKMRTADIYALLLKGQGVAQCYERPLWRSCGDIDLFFSEDNYQKAKDLLLPLASTVEPEHPTAKHLGMTIDSWMVEIHGLLRCSLSCALNRELDNIWRDTFYNGNVRSWINEDGLQVFLLGVENDIIYTFIHFLNHFYKGGVGLRQICDWIRLLWFFRTRVNRSSLEMRIRKSGLTNEWKAFGALAVDYLGMPEEAMPMYSTDAKWKRKAAKICSFVIEVGNMGHNRDMNYYANDVYIIRKIKSLYKRLSDLSRHIRIFPMDSMRYLPNIIINGLRAAFKGE
jgi:hypothetical protein